MSQPDQSVEKNLDVAQEQPKQKDVLTAEESKKVQEGAADQAQDRRKFLINSLGKAISPSTEVLKDMVMNIYDGAVKLVGKITGEVAKPKLPEILGDIDKGFNPTPKEGSPQISPQDLDRGFNPVPLPTGELSAEEIAKELKKLIPDDLSKVAVQDNSKPLTGGGREIGSSLAPADSQKQVDNAAKLGDLSNDTRSPEERTKALNDNPTLKAPRQQLEKDLKDLEKKDPDKALEMRKHMEEFEKRAANANPPLSPEEVAKTYKAVDTLLKAKDNPALPGVKAEDRQLLAEQILKQAADPSTIEQGEHNTCAVTTMENRMFARNPAAAAEMIAQVATTGEYTTHSKPPKTIKVDPASLEREPGTANTSFPDRSYADQIFQVTAANISHQKYGIEIKDKDGNVVKTIPPDSAQYRQGKPEAGPPPTTGESVVDIKTGEPIKDASGNPIQDPHVRDNRITDVYNDISGADPPESGIMLANESNVGKGDGNGVTQFKTEDEFKAALEKAKAEGKMPIILKVHTAQEPFFTESGGGKAGGSGGPHVVVITDYDPKTGDVQVDNQWGKGSDHSFKVSDLYKGTVDPKESIKTLQAECEENIKNGKVDYKKEIELLRLKHTVGEPKLGNAEYDRQLEFLAKQAVLEATEKNGGKLDKQTQMELMGAFNQIAKEDPKRFDAMTEKMFPKVMQGIAAGDVSFAKDDISKAYADFPLDKDVDKIFKAKGTFDDDEDAIFKALEGKSPAQIARMNQIFKEKHGKTMEDFLKDDVLNEEEFKKAKAIMNGDKV